MKKLLLGLCLTVGISGMSLANGIGDIHKNILQVDEYMAASENMFEQTVVNKQNHCGAYIGTDSSPITYVQCEEGQVEGSTTTYYWTWIEPTPVTAHICECSH